MRAGTRITAIAIGAIAAMAGTATAQTTQTCRMDKVCEPGQGCVPTDAFDIFVGVTDAAPTVGYSSALIQPATPRPTEGGVDLIYTYAGQTEVLRILTSGPSELLLPSPNPQTPRVFRGVCGPRG